MPTKAPKPRRPLKLWQAMTILQLAMLIPGLIVQSGIYYRWYHAARAGQLNERAELARGIARTVETYVLGIRHQAEAAGTAMLAMKPGEAANAVLDTIGRQSDSVGYMHWVNPEGVIVASSLRRAIGANVSVQPYFEALKAGNPWVASDLLFSPAGEAGPAFVVACAAREGDRLQGVIVAEVETKELARILSDRANVGEVAVYDAKGVLLFQYPGQARLAQVSHIDQDPLLARALHGREAAGEVVSMADQSWQLAARAPIPGLGWVAAAERPRSEVVTPMIRSFASVMGLVAVVVALSSAVAAYISRRIVGDVNRLREHAVAVGKGELDHPVQVDGIAEMRELALAYRDMAVHRKEAEDGQRSAAEKLARSNQDLQQFAYTASHDLQEPLRTIKGFVDLLARRYQGKLDASADEYIHFVVDGADRMSHLISDLLAYSRVDSRTEEFSAVDCNQVWRSVLENLQGSIQESGAVLKCEELPKVRGDATLLAQLFQNLLSNAIKFRDQRPPMAHVSARWADSEWEFSVRDNGIGIDPQQSQRLFVMFQRLHDRGKYPGTGIGLATCKRIVDRHGGRIWMESQPGQGSTFLFTIPAERTA